MDYYDLKLGLLLNLTINLKPLWLITSHWSSTLFTGLARHSHFLLFQLVRKKITSWRWKLKGSKRKEGAEMKKKITRDCLLPRNLLLILVKQVTRQNTLWFYANNNCINNSRSKNYERVDDNIFYAIVISCQCSNCRKCFDFPITSYMGKKLVIQVMMYEDSLQEASRTKLNTWWWVCNIHV